MNSNAALKKSVLYNKVHLTLILNSSERLNNTSSILIVWQINYIDRNINKQTIKKLPK